MNENSHLPPTEDTRRELGKVGLVWCSWHHGYTINGKLVQVLDRASSGGGVQFACLSCRRDHGLLPVDPGA